MRAEYWAPTFWLVVVGSWVFGVAYGYWVGDGIFLELSKAVRVPSPSDLGVWWQPLFYFTLSALALFLLAQIFFGAGAVLSLFARGVYDSSLILAFEETVRGWSFPSIPIDEMFTVLFILLILAVNLPLCLWSAHLGTQRAVYTWYRLRGKPIKPGSGVFPISNLLLILAASLAAGLVGAFMLSYT